jgi:hypothetical protein
MSRYGILKSHSVFDLLMKFQNIEKIYFSEDDTFLNMRKVYNNETNSTIWFRGKVDPFLDSASKVQSGSEEW